MTYQATKFAFDSLNNLVYDIHREYNLKHGRLNSKVRKEKREYTRDEKVKSLMYSIISDNALKASIEIDDMVMQRGLNEKTITKVNEKVNTIVDMLTTDELEKYANYVLDTVGWN